MGKTDVPVVLPGVLTAGGNNGPFEPGLDKGLVCDITGKGGRVALGNCLFPISNKSIFAYL